MAKIAKEFSTDDVNSYIKANKAEHERQSALNTAIQARPREDYIFAKEKEDLDAGQITPRSLKSPIDIVRNKGDVTDIDMILPDTYKAYREAHSKNLESLMTPVSVQYGKLPRQNLDIYSPPELDDMMMPTLVFLYGGGLIQGEKSGKEGIFWNNVGTYFARKGFITVIPDYRLVNIDPKATDEEVYEKGCAAYPSGASDLAQVVQFLVDGDQDYGFDLAHIFFMAQSAGGIHLASYLYYYRSAMKNKAAIRCRGAIFMSVPFDFENANAEDQIIMKKYYGSSDNAASLSPLALRRKVKRVLPDQLNVLAEKDPDDAISRPNRRFKLLFDKKLHVQELTSGKPPDEILVPNHNHVSLILSLGLDSKQEDAWADEVVYWMNSRIDGWSDHHSGFKF